MLTALFGLFVAFFAFFAFWFILLFGLFGLFCFFCFLGFFLLFGLFFAVWLNRTKIQISLQCAMILNKFVFVSKDSAGDRANKIFRELDTNGDGELDENEFVRGCLDDGDLLKMLNSGGLCQNNDQDD